MTARNFVNGAPLLPLSVGVNDSAVTLQVSSTTGYPTAPFTLALERGTANEEVVLCTAKSANTFTVQRGYDGTTGKAHLANTSIEHATAALDYAEANAHINGAGDVHAQYMLKSTLAAKGNILSASGASTPAVLSVGSNNQVLIADSTAGTGLKWGSIGASSITDGVLTLAKLDAALQQKVVQVVTTGTLPGSPANGQIVHTTDDNRWVGRNNGAWTPLAFGVGKVTVSTLAPSGGADGDLWLRYS